MSNAGKVLHTCSRCGRNYYDEPLKLEDCGRALFCKDCEAIHNEEIEQSQVDYVDFYKRFAQGEQNLRIVNNRIVEEQTNYYWQENDIYNFILPIITKYKTKIAEMSKEAVYGVGGFIAQLEPIQRAYNKVMRKQMEIINRINFTPLAVEDGSIDMDDIEDDGLSPGKVLVYRQGAKQPQYMSSGTEEYRCLEDMRKHLISMLNWLMDLYIDEDFDMEKYIL